MQYNLKQLGKIVIALMGMSMGVITLLLFVEYRFFHDQAQKMMELKEEYRAYVQAVKKVLNEYNAMKEQQDTNLATSVAIMDEQIEQKEFTVVNRELSYLKQCMIDYMREQYGESMVRRIDMNDWVEYNDQVLQTYNGHGKNKKRHVARKNNAVSAQALKYYAKQTAGPKDLALHWPIDRSAFWLSSFFGPRRKPDRSWGFHYGVDMAACRGTQVYAAAQGVVVEASSSNKGYGNTIVIQHNRKYKTRYAHLDKILVTLGKKVECGDLIGKVGSTGAVRSKRGRPADHLHFEVYAFGKQVNPLYFFG